MTPDLAGPPETEHMQVKGLAPTSRRANSCLHPLELCMFVQVTLAFFRKKKKQHVHLAVCAMWQAFRLFGLVTIPWNFWCLGF